MKSPVAIGVVIISGLIAARAGSGAEGELTAVQSRGKALYERFCLSCHAPRMPGAYMLEKRLGAEDSLLDRRRDLDAGYIRAVVRKGMNGMLAYRKTEITDAELDEIAEYLTRIKSGASG